MRRLVSLLAYLGSFFAARGLLFASPLLLASYLPVADYAHLEWALATATLASAVLTLGTGGLVPIVVVGTASPGITLRAIQLQHLAVAGLAVTGMATWLLGSRVWQVALLMGTLSLVTLKSTELKSHGRANASLGLDAMMLAAMATLAFLGSLVPASAFSSPWLAPAGMFIVLGGMVLRELDRSEPLALRREWRQVMVAGFPLMVTGALATLMTTSGRAGAGLLLDTDGAAAYSVMSRGAALPIIAHQVMVVAGYRLLFLSERARLQRLLLTIIGGVALSALALWWLTPGFAWLLGPAFASAGRSHAPALLLLLAQSVLWSGIALNDMLNVRHECSAAILRWSLPAALVILPLAYGAFQFSTRSLQAFVTIHAVAMLAFYLWQCLAMQINGQRMRRVAGSVAACFLALIGIGMIT